MHASTHACARVTHIHTRAQLQTHGRTCISIRTGKQTQNYADIETKRSNLVFRHGLAKESVHLWLLPKVGVAASSVTWRAEAKEEKKHTYSQTHIPTHMCTYTHKHTHTRTYVRMRVQARTQMDTDTDTFTPVRIHTHTCTCIHKHTSKARTCARTLTRTRTHKYIRPRHEVEDCTYVKGGEGGKCS